MRAVRRAVLRSAVRHVCAGTALTPATSAPGLGVHCSEMRRCIREWRLASHQRRSARSPPLRVHSLALALLPLSSLRSSRIVRTHAFGCAAALWQATGTLVRFGALGPPAETDLPWTAHLAAILRRRNSTAIRSPRATQSTSSGPRRSRLCSTSGGTLSPPARPPALFRLRGAQSCVALYCAVRCCARLAQVHARAAVAGLRMDDLPSLREAHQGTD